MSHSSRRIVACYHGFKVPPSYTVINVFLWRVIASSRGKKCCYFQHWQNYVCDSRVWIFTNSERDATPAVALELLKKNMGSEWLLIRTYTSSFKSWLCKLFQNKKEYISIFTSSIRVTFETIIYSAFDNHFPTKSGNMRFFYLSCCEEA